MIEGEYLIHFDDDTFIQHFPASIDLDTMEAQVEDTGSYWEPDEPIGEGWGDSSWEEIVTDDGDAFPAVNGTDDDGIMHMEDSYGVNEFIVVHFED